MTSRLVLWNMDYIFIGTRDVGGKVCAGAFRDVAATRDDTAIPDLTVTPAVLAAIYGTAE